MIIKNATYKSKQHVHICWVFLAFKHQPNQQANGYNEGHHQKLWSTRNKDSTVNWPEVHVKVTAALYSFFNWILFITFTSLGLTWLQYPKLGDQMPLSHEYTKQKEGMEKKTEIHPWLPALNLYCVLTIVRLGMMFEVNASNKLSEVNWSEVNDYQWQNETFARSVFSCVCSSVKNLYFWWMLRDHYFFIIWHLQ